MTIDWNAVRKDIEWLEQDYDWIAAQQRQLDAMRKIIAPNLDVIQSTGEAFATMSDFVSDYNRLHAQAADAMGSVSPVPEIKVYTGSELDWVDHVAIPEIVETSAQLHKKIQERIDLPSLIDLPSDFNSLVGGSLVEAVGALHRFIDDWSFSHPDSHILDDIAREVSSYPLPFDELNDMILEYAMSNYEPQWAQAFTSSTIASRRREPLDPVLAGIGLLALGNLFFTLGVVILAMAYHSESLKEQAFLMAIGLKLCDWGVQFSRDGIKSATRNPQSLSH